MTSIQITGWEKDAQDYNGKTQSEVFHVVVNGREKAMGRTDLIRTIKVTLPERDGSEIEAVRVNGSS